MNTRTNLSHGGDPLSKEFTLAEIENYYRHGRQLQAEIIARAIGRAFRRLKGAASAAAETGQGDVAHTMTSSLAAIRSTAELLRDHPNLDIAERKRFLGRLLEEEQRLERLLPKALQGAA